MVLVLLINCCTVYMKERKGVAGKLQSQWSKFLWKCSYDIKHNYSGAPLLWTPWGPGKVSCIERCPLFRGKFTFRKHILDIAMCP